MKLSSIGLLRPPLGLLRPPFGLLRTPFGLSLSKPCSKPTALRQAQCERRGLSWLLFVALSLLLATRLAACGGGTSGDAGSTGPGTQQGALSLGLAGGAPAGYGHVWVTVDSVALHTDADRAWSGSDSSWQVIRLAAPVTLDLVAASNGAIAPLLAGKSVPAGSYAQLRLFMLRHDETLAASAQALSLAYNAQVDSADNTQHLPLEFADAGLGLRVEGPIVIGAGLATDTTVQWDLSRSLVRFSADDGVDRITLRPNLRAYDLANTGAIVGVMDKSLFCAPGVTSGCVYDVVASAQLPAADGSAFVSVRSTPVVVGDSYALFALYPLPTNTSYEVVIRGRNMRTMLVRAVPASAAELLAARPTQLGRNPADPSRPIPMLPVLGPQGDASADLGPPTTRAGAQIAFAQTLPGNAELPHEITLANTDPFTARLAQPLPLPSGALRVATYDADSVLAFTDVQPQEGADSFSVTTRGTRYDEPSWTAIVRAPGSSSVSFTAPAVQRKGGLANAALTVNLAGGSTQKYDAAELVVSDVGGIVATLDVTSLIGSGGPVMLQLPAGANAAALGGGAVYSVAVRAWKRVAPTSSLQWARAAPVVDLRSGSPASAAITLP